MAREMPAEQSADAAGSAGKEGLRRAKEVDVKELERRVHLAELRAREAEAELRFIEAFEKRKVLRLEVRERDRVKRREKGKSKRRGSDAQE